MYAPWFAYGPIPTQEERSHAPLPPPQILSFRRRRRGGGRTEPLPPLHHLLLFPPHYRHRRHHSFPSPIWLRHAAKRQSHPPQRSSNTTYALCCAYDLICTRGGTWPRPPPSVADHLSPAPSTGWGVVPSRYHSTTCCSPHITATAANTPPSPMWSRHATERRLHLPPRPSRTTYSPCRVYVPIFTRGERGQFPLTPS